MSRARSRRSLAIRQRQSLFTVNSPGGTFAQRVETLGRRVLLLLTLGLVGGPFGPMIVAAAAEASPAVTEKPAAEKPAADKPTAEKPDRKSVV